MRTVNKHLYEFGSFQLDTGDGMLLRDGQYVPLTPKALDTLVVLVEHNGRIVGKEELLRQVWPDTFVEDVTLAKNVSTLRKILGDSEEHRYIETIPKRGYRFVAKVRLLGDVPAQAPAPIIIPEPPAPLPTRRSSPWPWLALLLIGVSGAVAWKLTNEPAPSLSSLKNIPLTSFSGRQGQIAFSPDGKQIAFVWDGPRHDGSHIYVKGIGGESLVQLTHGPAADSKPAWSPDGRQISFLRVSETSRAWYLIPALGGQERKLSEVSPDFDLGNANSPYFSSDGKSLAIVDRLTAGGPTAIFGLSIAGAERQKLSTPPSGTQGDLHPAFSPDGTQLAFSRSIAFSAADVYILSLASQKLRRLTFDGLPIAGLAWTANSREIVFSSRRGGSINSLWRVAAAGGAPQSVGPTAEELTSPAISPSGNQLAYTRALDDINIWSVTLDPSGRATSKTPLIASTFRDSDPDYSPDGTKIAFVSGRLGSFGIWVCNHDGTNARLLYDGGPYVSGSPHWSPDGRWIAFDSRSKGTPFIGIIGSDGRQFRQLSAIGEGNFAPSWSRDGRFLYFGSRRSGTTNIWKMPFAGGTAVQMTQNGGSEGFESGDGKLLYFLRSRSTPGLWQIPVEGGEESPVAAAGAVTGRSWRVEGKGIYLAPPVSADGPKIEYIDLQTGRTREITRMERATDFIIPSLAVSSDRTRMLYSQYDHHGSNIMMVEGFR